MYGAQFWLWNLILKFNSEWWVLSQSWNMVYDSDLSYSQINKVRVTQGRDLLQVCFGIKQLEYCSKENMKVVLFIFIDCVQPSFYHEESSSRPYYHTFGEKKSGLERNTDDSRKRAGKSAAERGAWPRASPDVSSAVWAEWVAKEARLKSGLEVFWLHGCLCFCLRRMLL